jgi:hypothetical protein
MVGKENEWENAFRFEQPRELMIYENAMKTYNVIGTNNAAV